MLIYQQSQANPLNTYLCSKPTFTSPQPLAAASGLTIPLQITLSEIKLSAFIIIVFSKQKGLTLVFRNDPLESLKVSSTFDSIQFVRDYLQRTIEGKLRDLMMDELPAIIHRLSLELWCPDQVPKDEFKEDSEPAVNPLATPPLDAVDAKGHLLDPSEISSLSLDGGLETQSLFSQKNLIRLAALATSQRTLSLFTPGIHDVLYRAKGVDPEQTDANIMTPLSTPSLKSHNQNGMVTTYTFSDTSSNDHGHLPSRPSLVSLGSAITGLSLGSGRHSKTGRKKKTRVVNLRRKTTSEDVSVTSEDVSVVGDTASETASTETPLSEPIVSSAIPEEPEEDFLSPAQSTPSKVRFQPRVDRSQVPPRPPLPMESHRSSDGCRSSLECTDAQTPAFLAASVAAKTNIAGGEQAQQLEKTWMDHKGPISAKPWGRRGGRKSDTSSVILEQAWISRMAGEIARRVYDEKSRNPAFWNEREETPPPAYESN